MAKGATSASLLSSVGKVLCCRSVEITSRPCDARCQASEAVPFSISRAQALLRAVRSSVYSISRVEQFRGGRERQG